jgi:hypothetical protein
MPSKRIIATIAAAIWSAILVVLVYLDIGIAFAYFFVSFVSGIMYFIPSWRD